MNASEVHMLFNVLRDLRVTNAVNLASLVVLTYDILLTLGDEIEYVWKAQWSFGKMLFFLNRYPVVVVTIFLTITDIDGKSSLIMCEASYRLDGWSTLAFILPVQLIFCLRTFALWERNRKVLAFLIVLMVACDSVMCFFIWMSERTGSFVFPQHPELRELMGCYATMLDWTTSFKIIIPAVAALMAFDAAILTLTISRYISIRKDGEGNGTVLRVLFRDGILYYAVVFVSSVANLILYAVLPKQRAALIGMLVPLLRTVMSVCANRLMLNLRGTIDQVRSRTQAWSSNSRDFRSTLTSEEMNQAMELRLRLGTPAEYQYLPNSSCGSLREGPRTPMSPVSTRTLYRPRSTTVVEVVTNDSNDIKLSALSDVPRGDGDCIVVSSFDGASTLLDTTVSCEGITSDEWIGVAV